MNHSQNIPILKKNYKSTEAEIQQIPRSRNEESYIKVHHNQIALLKTDDKKKILKAEGEKRHIQKGTKVRMKEFL